jgi:hypothetical protein
MPSLEPINDQSLAERVLRSFEAWRQKLIPYPDYYTGAGTPEGVIFASKGSTYFNTTGSAGTLLYVKNTAAILNTGWVAYG